MIRNFAALISLAVVFSGSFALSAQSVDAKTSRNNSHIARDYFVPPPPPYTPSLVPSSLGMADAQALTMATDDAVGKKPGNSYSNMFTRNQGDMPKVVKPNPYVGFDRGAELKIQKHIDSIDSEISGIEKEIGKLLDL